jgi:hypothetical protein
MVKSGVLGLMWVGFVECFVFAVVQPIDAIDEKANPVDEKLSSKGVQKRGWRKPWIDYDLFSLLGLVFCV